MDIEKITITMTIAENINILGNYCGKRDIEELTTENLQREYHVAQSDVMVLFGGSRSYRMRKLKMILILCCVSIHLCACGQNVFDGENDHADQTTAESGTSGSIDETETIRDKESQPEQNSAQNKSLILRSDSELEEWKQGYLNYLDTLDGADSCAYSLIYVDDDEIPELAVEHRLDGGRTSVDGGCRVLLTFHDGLLDQWEPLRSRFTYIEGENLICKITNNVDVNERFCYNTVYTIQDGKWVSVGGGGYRESVDTSVLPVKMAMLFGSDIDGEKYLIQEYSWGDESVSGEEYAARLNAIYPEGQGMYPQKYYGLDDICAIIRTGDVASAGHRYELVVEDATWEEAAAHCQEKGGYLATITSQEEMDRIQAQVISEQKTDITFYVGAKDLKWLEHGTEEVDVMCLYTALDFWLGGELEYRCQPHLILLYHEPDERCYLTDAENDILESKPSYTGKVGYICEYDS